LRWGFPEIPFFSNFRVNVRNPAVKFFDNIFFDAFSLRGKIEEKLDELLREDIIEKVDETTPWVNPVVVVRSGYVWICALPEIWDILLPL
jgi:hypothetical protein